MLFFNKLITKKFAAVICLLVTAAILNIGCAPSERSSGSLTTKYSLEALLYTIGTLDDFGIMPRALPVPITSGEIPFGFLVNIEDASIALLVGFDGLTQQEIEESSNLIIPILTSLLEESFGGSVTMFSPQGLASLGLTDSQAVHNLVLNDLLNNITFYSRVYVTKVDGLQGTNIRMDFYGWASGLLEPGQFLIRLEFQESLFNQLFAQNLILS